MKETPYIIANQVCKFVTVKADIHIVVKSLDFANSPRSMDPAFAVKFTLLEACGTSFLPAPAF